MSPAKSIFERYRIDTEVVMGAGCLAPVLGDWCERVGLAGLLVFGRGQSVRVEDRERLVANLQSRGLNVRTVSGAHSNVPLAHLHQLSMGIDFGGISWVAAVGGGGVIDTGKILALRSREHFAVQAAHSFEELRDRVDEFDSLPFLAAPTCLGSGAEVNALSDVLLDSAGVRAPIISPAMYPKLAVVDCSIASPPSQIQAAAIVDTVTHLLDPWLNSLPGPVFQVDTTIALLRSLRRITQGWAGGGLEQSTLLRLATIGHLAVRPGLARPSAPVSAIHRIEHVLSPRVGCSHGEGLALLLPGFLRWMEVSRPDLLAAVAEHFGSIFGREALPSVLVEEWLRSLPLEPATFNVGETAANDIAETVIAVFGDSRGMLPGELSIGRSEVGAILRETTSAGRREGTRVDAHLSGWRAVNSERLFGGSVALRPCHVIITPVSVVFDALCLSGGAVPRRAWFPTAIVHGDDDSQTLLVCSSPGSSMVEDCLEFLSVAAGFPDSLLFVGFAGSLTPELDCGEFISPRYVLVPRDPVQTDLLRLDAIPLQSLSGNGASAHRAWTVRSASRMTEESSDLLEAWRWAGVDLVDLETSGVAHWCAKTHTPFSALLVVSDRPLDGAPLWTQPPLASGTVVTLAVERVAAEVRALCAKPRRRKTNEENTDERGAKS